MARRIQYECNACSAVEVVDHGQPSGWRMVTDEGEQLHAVLHFCPPCGDEFESFIKPFIGRKPEFRAGVVAEPTEEATNGAHETA